MPTVTEAEPASPRSIDEGRSLGRAPVEAPVERLPVGREAAPCCGEGEASLADPGLGPVLQGVLDVIVGGAASGLGEEVRERVRAAELERDDVVDLDRVAVVRRGQPVLALD